jgi:hypothetical protein
MHFLLQLLRSLIGNKTRKTRTTEGFTPWDEFNPNEYARRNYLRLGNEDKQIIKFTIEAAHRLEKKQYIRRFILWFFRKFFQKFFDRFLRRYFVLQGADVGCGPYFGTAEFLEGLGCEELHLYDHSPNNCAFMQCLLDPDGDHVYQFNGDSMDTHEPWPQFEKYMVDVGGERFRGCFQRALKKAQIKQASVYELTKKRYRGKYHRLGSMYVADSITTEIEECKEIVEINIDMVAIGGIAFFAFMHDSSKGEYHAGDGTKFPSTRLTLETASEFFDLIRGISYESFKTEGSDHHARDGYDGMMVFVVHVKWTRMFWRMLWSIRRSLR